MTCLVLLALANVCLLVPDHRQEEAFLAGLGLSHMKDVFREQEVRVEMIPHLDNATLSHSSYFPPVKVHLVQVCPQQPRLRYHWRKVQCQGFC